MIDRFGDLYCFCILICLSRDVRVHFPSIRSLQVSPWDIGSIFHQRYTGLVCR